MINLFLSGGGGKEQTDIIDKEFVMALDLDKPLLYIVIGSSPAYIFRNGDKYVVESNGEK